MPAMTQVPGSYLGVARLLMYKKLRGDERKRRSTLHRYAKAGLRPLRKEWKFRETHRIAIDFTSNMLSAPLGISPMLAFVPGQRYVHFQPEGSLKS